MFRANRCGVAEPEPYERGRPGSATSTVTFTGSQDDALLAGTLRLKQRHEDRRGLWLRVSGGETAGFVIRRSGSAPRSEVHFPRRETDSRIRDEMRIRDERVGVKTAHAILAQVKAGTIRERTKLEQGACEAAESKEREA